MESDSNNHRHDPTVDVGEKGEERVGHTDADGEAGGGGGGGGDPADGVMVDIDGEDLIFSDDTFPSLPDFPCLSSPSASPSPSSARNTCLSSSSSSSSSSASWPFLKVPAGGRGGDMQSHGAVVPSVEDAMMIPTASDHHRGMVDSEVMDILGDIDLLDLSEDTFDPSYLFPDESTMIEDGGTPLPGQQEDPTAEEGLSGGGGAEGATEDMANVFLEWLKSNKDTISPEDLRSIKLNRSTVDCASQRLGGGKQGRVQLLKLILAWVQNHHLLKKRRRLRQQQQQQDRPVHHGSSSSSSFSYHYQNHQPFPPPHHQLPVLSDATINPNPNLDHYTHDPAACKSWIPYPADATTAAAVAFPSMMMPYGSGGVDLNGAAPYHYPTSSIVVNTQPFSPSSDFHAIEAAASWPPTNFPAAAPPYSPFPGPSTPHPAPQYPGSFASQYTGQQLYHQAQGLAGLASATKEARKKRMARQRRSSSLHHPRHQNHPPHPNSHPEASSRPPTADGSSRTNTRNWAFWSSTSSSPHQTNSTTDPLPAPPNVPTMPPPPPPPPPQQQPQQRNAASSDKRQGWKSEKNLRFLLQKVLKQSDVGSLGRIVLPKKEAEIHLPELDARDGISIPMEDIGTSRVWNMRYRFWPNNKSRMYLLENTGDFVRSNGLKEGDFIVIYSDVKCGKYMIRGVKVRHPPPEAKAAGGKNSGKAHSKRGGGGQEKNTAGASKGTAANRNNCDGNKHKSPPPTEDDGGHASPTNIKIEGSP